MHTDYNSINLRQYVIAAVFIAYRKDLQYAKTFQGFPKFLCFKADMVHGQILFMHFQSKQCMKTD